MSLFFYHLAYLFDFMINIIILLRYLFYTFHKTFRFKCRNVVCRNFIVVFFRNISSSFSALVLTINFQIL
jgi:hypothetical protein